LVFFIIRLENLEEVKKKHSHDEWNEFESRFDDNGHWIKVPKGPESFAQESEGMNLISNCLEKLPSQQRSAFTLKEVQELSGHEISEIMGVSVNNLGVLSFRAKANLRECLEKANA